MRAEWMMETITMGIMSGESIAMSLTEKNREQNL